MDPNLRAMGLEEENGYVLRLQAGDAVPHVHAYAVHQVVAVGLDNQLALGTGGLAEKADEGRLRAGGEMYLWLLQEKLLWSPWMEIFGTLLLRVIAQQLRKNRECLADAIANIHEVSPWSFVVILPRFPHLHLKGIAIARAKTSYSDFIKEASALSEVFETLLQLIPHLRLL